MTFICWRQVVLQFDNNSNNDDNNLIVLPQESFFYVIISFKNYANILCQHQHIFHRPVSAKRYIGQAVLSFTTSRIINYILKNAFKGRLNKTKVVSSQSLSVNEILSRSVIQQNIRKVHSSLLLQLRHNSFWLLY